jgi:formylglycine-generating enzyme required for sulfatase activity
MKAMKMIGFVGICTAGLLAFGCDGGGGGGDGGQDGDGGIVPAWGCPFEFTAPRVHSMVDEFGNREEVRDRHVLCALEHGALRAEILFQAEPTGFQGMDTLYRAWRAFLCRDARVSELAADAISYEARHHGWDVMQVVLEGRRYVFRWSEVCVGYRPCTESFDRMDVRDQATGALVEGMLPVACVELGPSGRPRPLTPMARVPAAGLEATFSMGSQDGAEDERPVREVRLLPHRVDVREATWGDLAQFLDDHGSTCGTDPCLDLAVPEVGLEFVGGRHLPKTGREAEPAGFLPWTTAMAFCEWRRLELPTEAVWELAASAEGTRVYPWGAEAPDCTRAVFAGCGAQGPRPTCSAAAGASAEGVCDLAGNLAEWAQDWYAADHYATPCDPSPCENPRGPEAPTGARVLRGGAFDSPGDSLRAAARGHAPPDTATARVGVRCARSTLVWDHPAPEP